MLDFLRKHYKAIISCVLALATGFGGGFLTSYLKAKNPTKIASSSKKDDDSVYSNLTGDASSNEKDFSLNSRENNEKSVTKSQYSNGSQNSVNM